jgi:hypothetical protein
MEFSICDLFTKLDALTRKKLYTKRLVHNNRNREEQTKKENEF